MWSYGIAFYGDILHGLYKKYNNKPFLFQEARKKIKGYDLTIHRKMGADEILINTGKEIDGRIRWKLNPLAIRWLQNSYKV